MSAEVGLTEAEREALFTRPRELSVSRDTDVLEVIVARIKADAIAQERAERDAKDATHQQRADHFQHLYEQASEGKCGFSGLAIDACKASICDCFEFQWVVPTAEHPALLPSDATAARGTVREQAKAEALRELADDIDSTGYGWTSVVDAERFKDRLRARAADTEAGR